MGVHTVQRLEDLPDPTPDGAFVVVDVIISSTSIIRLLEEGAAYVRPFAEIDRAREFKRETEDALLVGEDGGGPIPGFDLTPLPSLIAAADVEGRPVGIRTSNGTRAVERIGLDNDVFVGSTINAAGVADAIAGRAGEVWIVAAGRRGTPTPEDTAGARLIEGQLQGTLSTDQRNSLAAEVSESETAEWLREGGFEADLDALLSFGSTTTVPTLRNGVFVSD